MKTDTQLQKDVMDELKWQPSVKSSGIGVAVNDGIVTLSGTVDNYVEKREAERAAMRVEGVRGIAEDIEVELPFSHRKDDAEIAKAAVSMLRWDSRIPDKHIKIKVENGWITAEGKVDWLYQKYAVYKALNNIMGVRGVINLVTIESDVNPVDVKEKIVRAFNRSASIDATNITVEIKNHKVILNGFVRSYAEKLDAQRAAWNAPGVTQVEDRLVVKIPSYSEV